MMLFFTQCGRWLLRLARTVDKHDAEALQNGLQHAKSIQVECPGINVYADGDFACPLPAEISAVPAALRILRPV